MSKKNHHQKKLLTKFFIFVIILCLLVAFLFLFFRTAINESDSLYSDLYQHIFIDNKKIIKKINQDLKQSPVKSKSSHLFLSLSDGQSQARVFKGEGKNFTKAWDSAVKKAQAYSLAHQYQPIWLKADLVNYVEQIDPKMFNYRINQSGNHEFFRYGLSLDSNLNTAFLEGEINANQLISYRSTRELNYEAVNQYLQARSQYDHSTSTPLNQYSSEIYFFSAYGFFCDQNQCHNLYSNPEMQSYGRRENDYLSAERVQEIATLASDQLSNSIKDNGQFVYGWQLSHRLISGYNVVRHAGATWGLLNQYRLTPKPELLTKIELALSYLEKQVVYQDEKTAYVVEYSEKEIKLGANALAIIAFIEYMEATNSQKYQDLVISLGQGITRLMTDLGEYNHVLFYQEAGKKDYDLKEKFRIVYYDGEATFALTKLYSFTQEEKWLTAAKLAIDNFIAADYTKYIDHWIAHALNEVLKYTDNGRYYEFALRNAHENLYAIAHQPTAFHTYFELLMATFEVYDRLMSQKINLQYLETFNEKMFINTIFARAQFMLDAYFYPEIAMYMPDPAKIVNSFFIRHDLFRSRIDDVQHFLTGYYIYLHQYDRLLYYQKLLSQ